MNACHKAKERSIKEKKQVIGWCTEEMKEKPNVSLKEDTEEMSKWRGLSQNEMDQCWKNFAGRMEEEVLDKYKVEESKREAFRGSGVPLESRRRRKNKKKQNKKVVRRLLGKE